MTAAADPGGFEMNENEKTLYIEAALTLTRLLGSLEEGRQSYLHGEVRRVLDALHRVGAEL